MRVSRTCLTQDTTSASKVRPCANMNALAREVQFRRQLTHDQLHLGQIDLAHRSRPAGKPLSPEPAFLGGASQLMHVCRSVDMLALLWVYLVSFVRFIMIVKSRCHDEVQAAFQKCTGKLVEPNMTVPPRSYKTTMVGGSAASFGLVRWPNCRNRSFSRKR